MASQELDPVQIGELRGFLRAYASLQQALTISNFDYDVTTLEIEGSAEETLQSYFDGLGQKLKPPVKHWDMNLNELKPWEVPVEELFSRWLLQDDELRTFYKSRREKDPRPGELHVGTNDIARRLRERIEALLGKGKKRVWEVSIRALVGQSDRYLASLDDHLAIEHGDSLLLISFSMQR